MRFKDLIHQKRILVLNTALMLVFAFTTLLAEARVVKSLNIVADKGSAWFLNGKLEVGVEVFYNKGLKRRTTGYLNGDLGWRKIQITCAQGTVSRGVIKVDLNKVKANNNTITIDVVWDNDPTKTAHLDLVIPELQTIKLIIPEDAEIIPGKSFQPVVFFQFKNGIKYLCEPWSKSSLIKPNEITLYMDRDTVPDGIVMIPNDVLSKGLRPMLSVVWNKNPELFDMQELTIEFDYTETLYFSELKASAGVPGSVGGVNQDGQQGQAGSTGKHALLLDIYMWFDNDSLQLKIHTVYDEMQNDYSFKPGAGKLEIILKGGDGGDGGEGGQGGDGEDGTNQSGGRGGDGGNGGDGGKGGKIRIFVEKEAEVYLPQLSINNSGGVGGIGGKGGRGGKMGDAGQSSFFEVLFPPRNGNGNDGYPGNYGADGPEAEIIATEEAEIKLKVSAK